MSQNRSEKSIKMLMNTQPVKTLKDHWFIVALALIGTVVFFMNRDHAIERGIFDQYIVPYASFLSNGGQPGILSYPMWGYPVLLSLFGQFGLLVIQWVASIYTYVILDRVIFEKYRANRLAVCIVLIGSIPWFAYASVKSPSGLAVSLVWFAIAVLIHGMRRQNVNRNIVVGGILFGIVLNFRSEFLALLGLLAVVIPLSSSVTISEERLIVVYSRLRQMVAFCGVALILLLPWVVVRSLNGQHFTLTSSNLGLVGVVSLGQLPDNPWGLIHNDSVASKILGNVRDLDVRGNDNTPKAAVSEGGVPAFNPVSYEGDRLLRDYALSAIKSHPTAFLRKIVHNGRNIFLGGLYVGEVERWFSQLDRERFDVSKEKLKDLLSIMPNITEIERYKALGIWDQSVGSSLLFLMIAIPLIALGNLVIAAGTMGSLWTIGNRAMNVESILLITMLIFVFGMAALLQYEPRHINTALPALLGMFLVGWSKCGRFGNQVQ